MQKPSDTAKARYEALWRDYRAFAADDWGKERRKVFIAASNAWREYLAAVREDAKNDKPPFGG